MTTPQKEDPEALQLRGKPRPVTRLNRRMIVVLGGALMLAVALALMWGLRKPMVRASATPQEQRNVERVTRAEGLESLPRDYAALKKVPQLGAPIGELGRPVLRAEREAGIPELPERPSYQPNPEEDVLRAQRLREQNEAEAAIKGAVLVKLERQAAGAPSVDLAHTETSRSIGANSAQSGEREVPDVNGQLRKRSFVDEKPDARIYASATLQTPLSPYQLMAGTIISAALATGIKSDLPGQAIATVTENVFDTVSGGHLLIPQGSKLLGQYDSEVAYGQRRVLLVWTRLIMPDGSSITLDRLPATDAQGYAGLEDEVDWHWGRIFAGAAVSTLLGAGAALAAPDRSGRDGEVVIATRDGVQDSINQVGQEITRRNLDVQPTLTVRPGISLRIIINKDLILRPYLG